MIKIDLPLSQDQLRALCLQHLCTSISSVQRPKSTICPDL